MILALPRPGVFFIMISFSSPFDFDTHWKYVCLWHSLAVPIFDTPLQTVLIARLPDSIFSIKHVRHCSLFDCDFLDVILFVALPSNLFDCGY